MSIIKDYGICNIAIAPVRASASDESEIVTELLFGDYVKILEKDEPWIKIYFPADDYEGYMDFKQLKYIDEDSYDQGMNTDHKVMTNGVIKIHGPYGIQNIMFGSNLPHYSKGQFRIGEDKYQILGELTEYSKSFVATALTYLNTPYLWGGKGIFGIDCSGLIQMTAKIHGIKMPRDASDQVKIGEEINYSDRKIGDLMYFINAKGIVHHVGVITAANQIIHASGHVRIDDFDETGIYREDLNRHTHTYHSIRRI